jgi:hypothetical protein
MVLVEGRSRICLNVEPFREQPADIGPVCQIRIQILLKARQVREKEVAVGEQIGDTAVEMTATRGMMDAPSPDPWV